MSISQGQGGGQDGPRLGDLMANATIAGAKRRSFLAELAAELPAATPIIREGGHVAVNQASLRGDPALVRKAVEALPNTSELFPVRENYLKPGYAIKASLGDTQEAFDLYLAWCLKWPGGPNGPNTFDTVEADWRRMKPPFKVGFRWLAQKAHEHSAGAFDIGEVWFEKQPESLFPAGQSDSTSSPATRIYKFLSLKEAADSALSSFAQPLVQGLIHQGTMSVWYGPPKSYKTFVLLDLAYHIAAGRPWAGRKVTPGKIVYIIGEGGQGVGARAGALLSKHGDCPDLILLSTRIDLFNPNADLRPLTHAIKTLGGVCFVALDTLARVMAGADENSSKDMGVLIANADELRIELGCHLALVHHTGKDESRGARGSNALLGAIDTEVMISGGVIEVTNQRDFEIMPPIRFAIETVNLGPNAEGDPVTSAIIQLQEQGSAPIPKAMPPRMARVLEALSRLGDVGGTAEEVIDELKEAGHVVSKDGVTSALKRLGKLGRAAKHGRGAWIVLDPRKTPADWFEGSPEGIFD